MGKDVERVTPDEIISNGSVVRSEHADAVVIPQGLNATQFQKHASGNVQWLPQVHRGVHPGYVGKSDFDSVQARSFEVMHGLALSPDSGNTTRVDVDTNFRPSVDRRYSVSVDLGLGDTYRSSFRTPRRAQIAGEAMINRLAKRSALFHDYIHHGGERPQQTLSLKTGTLVDHDNEDKDFPRDIDEYYIHNPEHWDNRGR